MERHVSRSAISALIAVVCLLVVGAALQVFRGYWLELTLWTFAAFALEAVVAVALTWFDARRTARLVTMAKEPDEEWKHGQLIYFDPRTGRASKERRRVPR